MLHDYESVTAVHEDSCGEPMLEALAAVKQKAGVVSYRAMLKSPDASPGECSPFSSHVRFSSHHMARVSCACSQRNNGIVVATEHVLNCGSPFGTWSKMGELQGATARPSAPMRPPSTPHAINFPPLLHPPLQPLQNQVRDKLPSRSQPRCQAQVQYPICE